MSEHTFHIITFGCQMNVRDSQWLASALTARGFLLTQEEDAQFVIINTCSVREKPELKINSVLHRLGQNANNNQCICVLGCVAQQLGKDLFKNDSSIGLIAGGDSIGLVPNAICDLAKNPGQKISLLSFSTFYREKEADKQNEVSAFVNIMQGCDNFCSYCIVPYTRGRQRSRSLAAIVEECQIRISEGTREITLLGQNVNVWGKDIRDNNTFYGLLTKISGLPGIVRLRFVSAHPADMDDNVVKAFGQLPNLAPRLHLPLQSGSDKILQKMRRRYNCDDYLHIVEELRKSRADIALSTDLIVGFPGETEEDFENTLTMMTKCDFMSSYSFCYSDRPGTASAMMEDKIEDKVKHDRLTRLQALQDKLSQKWLDKRIGEKTDIILEGLSPRQSMTGQSWQGRDAWGTPINVEIRNTVNKGDQVKVEIIDSKKHSLAGRII